MRYLIAALALAACSEKPAPVVLDNPSPEPSTGIVERRCPDRGTELSTYIDAEGHIHGACVARRTP